MTDDAAAPGESRRTLGRSWPLYAAAAAVLAALLAVSAMLRPRGVEAGAEEALPATVTTGDVPLRSAASADSETSATLGAGTRVRAGAGSGRWVQVETDSGEKGFLPADAIERDSDRAARVRRSKTLLAFTPVFGVVGEDSDVALAPYPLAARGGRLTKGTVISIHSVDHSYFAFRDKTWGIAFVNSAHVDLVPPNPREPALSPEKIKPLKDLTIIDLEGGPPPEEYEEMVEDAAEPEGEPDDAVAAAPPPAVAAPGLVEPPVVLKRVDPAYPDLPRRAGIEGIVELEVSIDATGKVSDVEVVRGLPLGLSEAAAAAARRWTWKPARTASGPIASRRTVRIRFTLSPADEP